MTDLLLSLLLAQAFASAEESRAEHERAVEPFIRAHCAECHGPAKAKGDLDLATLHPDLKAPSAARWATVLEKVASGEMPPEGRPRPADAERDAVLRWIRAEAGRAGRSFVRREERVDGNLVPHDALFGAGPAAPFDAPRRLRRLSPEIYHRFWWDFARHPFPPPQPFSHDNAFTFKDMGAPRVDEPATIELLAGALSIVEQQTAGPRSRGELKALLDPSRELTRELMASGLRFQFQLVLKRDPTPEELGRFTAFKEKNVKDAGRDAGVRHALAAVFLLPEAVFRSELGAGPADARGRVRLSHREIAYALAFALSDRRPDAVLLKDADEGRLGTSEGVAAVVRRLLDDARFDKPRILRFFREYFEYDRAGQVFKDTREYPYHIASILVRDTDRLVEHVLAEDRDVLRELLTTRKAFPAHKEAAHVAREQAKHDEEKRKNPDAVKGKAAPAKGRWQYEQYNLKFWPPELYVPDVKKQKPMEMPAEQRAGILTQPAWLVAFSSSSDNHAIRRGKWVRERLLGGVVPDLPITVNAQLSDDPALTLRKRMEITRDAYCWKCHRLMNSLGLPFEQFDHFGRWRAEEVKRREEKGPPLLQVPADASGEISESGDPFLDGPVADAVELLRKLAASERVEQVFVRHAFRFWLGRPETPGDAPSLQAAHRAYRASGGSMKALITALLSSESFLYREMKR